ncbi:MAG: DUF881 domain-containing protein [Syntrophomonadaceae bacterium]|jgi:uncharacterized protein YlxW (UPF0749 family)
MRSKSAQVSIAVVCLVLGIMLAVQYRASQDYAGGYRTGRDRDLAITLSKITEERDSLAREVVELREKLNNVRKDDKAMADLQEELQKANMAAALVPVTGPGIIVTLNDSARNLQPGEDPNDLLVHDEDILKVTNELKASGAEAISVNDERLVATSEIRCAGTTILINSTKIAPPFVIKAIGDPDILQSGILIKGGYVEQYLKFYGIQVQVQKSKKVKIPAYSGIMKYVYSVPVEYEEKAE